MKYQRIVGNRIILVIVLFSMIALTSCTSKKLVDQDDKEMKSLIESVQTTLAQEGWTYKGYNVVATDKERDIATAVISYDVEGNLGSLLKKNVNTKAKNDYIYQLADKVNTKLTVELSDYEKDNHTVKNELKKTEWFVGDTTANKWIEEQNGKWKKEGEKVSFTTEHGELEVIIDGSSKTDWDDTKSSYMASIRATVKNINYKDPLYEEGVCQYDILDNKDIIVTTEDGISCAGGDVGGPTDGAYDPDTKVGKGETARMCMEVIVPKGTKKVILQFGKDAYMLLPINQKTIKY